MLSALLQGLHRRAQLAHHLAPLARRKLEVPMGRGLIENRRDEEGVLSYRVAVRSLDRRVVVYPSTRARR